MMEFLFFGQTLHLKIQKLYLYFLMKNIFPEGVIKKPSLYLADIFPDLNADKLFTIEHFCIFNYF